MNYLFLINAILLVLIGILAFVKKKDKRSLIFLLANIGLGGWNFSIFFLQEFYTRIDVNLFSKIQLISTLIYAIGLYLFSYSYRFDNQKMPIFSRMVHISILSFLSYFICFTEFVTKAVVFI